MKSNWNYPTNVWFGEGRSSDLIDACNLSKINNPLFVTDKDLITLPMTNKIIEDLKKTFDKLEVFSNFTGNPTGNNISEGVVSTKIEFITLSNRDIIKYASSSEPYKCAGGFAIEGRGGLFIKKIDGCFSNVIGLSLPWLKNNLETLGLSELLLDS